MTEIAKPSRDPANDDTLLGVVKTVLRKFLMGIDDMLPAKAGAFSRAQNRVTALPQVQAISTEGQRVSRAQVASAPVYQIGGGGFVLNFNIRPGDQGYIKACDRDTSLFNQTHAETSPNTKRLHSFEDGVFFPNVDDGFTIADEDAANAVLQSLDGSVRIALWPDRVKVTAPLVVCDTPLVHATQDVQVDGNLTVTGEITGSGIVYSTHVHDGVEPGSGNTGTPI